MAKTQLSPLNYAQYIDQLVEECQRHQQTCVELQARLAQYQRQCQHEGNILFSANEPKRRKSSRKTILCAICHKELRV